MCVPYDETQRPLSTLHHNIQFVDGSLRDTANALAQRPEDAWGACRLNMTGIWPNQSTAGTDLSSVAEDLNRLAINNQPSDVGDKDIGHFLADCMFGNNSSGETHLDRFRCRKIEFSDDREKIGFGIHGAFVYYLLPIGNEDKTCWHFSFSLWFTIIPISQLYDQQKRRFLKPAYRAPFEPCLMTTVSARYTSSVKVADVLITAVKDMLQDSRFDLDSSIEYGTTFRFTFRTAVDMKPIDIHQAFNLAIHNHDSSLSIKPVTNIEKSVIWKGQVP